MADWDHRFLELASHISGWSKDRTRGVGAVIVGPSREVRSLGFNGFPRGIDDDLEERHGKEDGEKYRWTEHAERNAIYNAARMGISLLGCTLYVNLFPCGACARAIIQSGITRVVSNKPDLSDARWGVEFELSRSLFEEAGIQVKTMGDAETPGILPDD